MNAFANVTDAGAHGAPELQSRHPPVRESIWHMGTPQHGSSGFAMSAREGQRARHDALDYRIDGTRELPPQVPRVVLRTCAESQGLHPLLQVGKQHVGSLSCQQLPANFGPGDHVVGSLLVVGPPAIQLSPLFRAQRQFPLRSSSDRLSHNAIANSARSPGGSLNSCASTLDSIGVILSCSIHCGKRVRWCMNLPGSLCDGCQANPSDLGSELK